MPKVSAKRQVTLPADQCRLAGIKPGDEYESYVDNDGQITIVRKRAGVARGILKRLRPKKGISDEESLASNFSP